MLNVTFRDFAFAVTNLTVINNLSQAIKLRRRVAATAIVHFRRFYWKCAKLTFSVNMTWLFRHCLLDFDPNLVAPTCLFVASKVEENLVQIHVFLEAMKIFGYSLVVYLLAHI